jgi:deoxyribodipyrimidine photo-lyase
MSFTPTRAAALARVAAFTPRMGRAYAGSRNSDTGPGTTGQLGRVNVSVLSPYVRHRLLTEEELARAAVGAHGLSAAEKFVQEVCWRTYWKGWLEARPAIWVGYRAGLERGLNAERAVRRQIEAAVAGRSGIACFDSWAEELIETGYLHNHARMWFASIWIHTLRLPWEVGADLFLQHLMDADAASNTLSWRWVAGLHTPGKTYLARPDNIAEFTGGRFRPREPLASEPAPLPADPAPAARPVSPASRWPEAAPERRLGVLLHEDDLSPESLSTDPGVVPGRGGGASVVALAGVIQPAARSPSGAGVVATTFTQGALVDALSRGQQVWGVAGQTLAADSLPTDLKAWATAFALTDVVTPVPTVGWTTEGLERGLQTLAANGVRVHRVRRAWDQGFYPHATKGFFQLKARIPEVLGGLGLPV